MDALKYAAQICWNGERNGELKSGARPPLSITAPPEFRGREGAWTPEHLYVGSVASCFMLTFIALAERAKLEIEALEVAAEGALEKTGGGFQFAEVVLTPTVVVRSLEGVARAEALVDKAERGCFIAASIKSRVIVRARVYHKQDPAYPCPPVSEARAG